MCAFRHSLKLQFHTLTHIRGDEKRKSTLYGRIYSLYFSLSLSLKKNFPHLQKWGLLCLLFQRNASNHCVSESESCRNQSKMRVNTCIQFSMNVLVEWEYKCTHCTEYQELITVFLNMHMSALPKENFCLLILFTCAVLKENTCKSSLCIHTTNVRSHWIFGFLFIFFFSFFLFQFLYVSGCFFISFCSYEIIRLKFYSL